MPVALQNVTIPGNRPQGRGYSSLRQFRMRARVNAFYRFVNPALALAWPELLPPALGAYHSLNPVSIVVLKFVMIIVIALAKRKQRQEKRVARAASRRIRLTPDGMTG